MRGRHQRRRQRHCRPAPMLLEIETNESFSTWQALHYAKRQGALCVGVTNTVGSAIAAATDCGIHINAGAEIGVASTKAYTSQIVALTLLSLVLAEDSVSLRPKYDRVVEALRELPESVRKVGVLLLLFFL